MSDNTDVMVLAFKEVITPAERDYGLALLGLPVDESKAVPCEPMSPEFAREIAETAANCQKLVDDLVTSFYDCHPDLHQAILADVFLLGTMRPETADALRQALERDK